MKPFLGRTQFNNNTMMYSFKDGTGAVPEEMRQDMIIAAENRTKNGGNGIFVLATLWAWKERLGFK